MNTNTETVTVYIANGNVLHHVQSYVSHEVEFFVNDIVILHEFPQVLPAEWSITAFRKHHVLINYRNVKTGVHVTKDEYLAEKWGHLDQEDDFLSREDELKWIMYAQDHEPISEERRDEITIVIVHFKTGITGEQYITCAPTYMDVSDERLKTGAFYTFEPDEIAMLKTVIRDLGMDVSRLHVHSESRIKFSKYDNEYIVMGNDDSLHETRLVTLEQAIEARERAMTTVLAWMLAFKGRHDPRPLTNGGFYRIIDDVIKDFAKVRVYASGRDVAGSIQRRLKDLLRRMETDDRPEKQAV